MLDKEAFRIPPPFTVDTEFGKCAEDEKGPLESPLLSTDASVSQTAPTPPPCPTSVLAQRAGLFFADTRRLGGGRGAGSVLAAHSPLFLPRSDSVSVDSREGTAGLRSKEDSRQKLDAEDDEGDVEYKWRLTGVGEGRFQHLVTQMRFRVSEGRGQCLYELGVTDSGVPRGLPRQEFEESVQTIQRMAATLGYEATVLQCIVVDQEPAELLCGELMVSRRQSSAATHDLTVAFCGAVAAGKSTLMGVLLSGELDDGRGGSRQTLFNHKHELDSGRTSSLAARVWTVTESSGSETVAPVADAAAGLTQAIPTPPFTCTSPRCISLLDAGGDITKTMLFGLMSRKPDYVCVCLAADTDSVEELGMYAQVCCAMNTPFIVVVTRCDLVEDFLLDGVLMDVAVALDSVGCASDVADSLPVVNTYCGRWLPQHREGAVSGPQSSPSHTGKLRVPIFCVSAVEGGDGLELFRGCLSHLQSTPPSPLLTPFSNPSSLPSFEVLLDSQYDVPHVGPILRGQVSCGNVEVGCSCYVGPDDAGCFYGVVVRSIHVEGEHVNEARCGDEATFALDRMPEGVSVAKKGKLLVRQPENVSRRFTATVTVLVQSLAKHMEPIMYTRNARQAVRICAIHDDADVSAAAEFAATSVRPNKKVAVGYLLPLSCAPTRSSNDLAVECEFLFRPEVVAPGSCVVLHWAPRGLAVGKITSVNLSS